MARKFLKLPDDILEKLESFAAAGLSIEQMGSILGMSKKTIERRLVSNPAAIDAIEKGRAKAIHNVGKSAYVQAISGNNTAMTIFYLKTRAGWKETQVNEHTGPNGTNLFESFSEMVKRLENADKKDSK